jgi:hypothetical protein
MQKWANDGYFIVFRTILRHYELTAPKIFSNIPNYLQFLCWEMQL